MTIHTGNHVIVANDVQSAAMDIGMVTDKRHGEVAVHWRRADTQYWEDPNILIRIPQEYAHLIQVGLNQLDNPN